MARYREAYRAGSLDALEVELELPPPPQGGAEQGLASLARLLQPHKVYGNARLGEARKVGCAAGPGCAVLGRAGPGWRIAGRSCSAAGAAGWPGCRRRPYAAAPAALLPRPPCRSAPRRPAPSARRRPPRR
jgi:hypothetical protein